MSKYPNLGFKVHESGGEKDGEFVWGKARRKLFDTLLEINENTDPDEALEVMEELLQEDPEFIEAYSRIGWWELEFANYGNAYHYFATGRKVGDAAIPKKYRGKIPWVILENRAYLKAMHGFGLTCLYLHEWENATEIFDKLLNYNPNDEQGIRGLAIQCYLAQGKFEEILKLVSRYPEDALPDTLYGAVYANFRLEKMHEAEQALITALEFAPDIAKRILQKENKSLADPNIIPLVEDDEIFEYWERYGMFWTDPRLLKFVENGMKSAGIKK